MADDTPDAEDPAAFARRRVVSSIGVTVAAEVSVAVAEAGVKKRIAIL